MIDLRDSWAAFASRMRDARSLCVLSDFDGTLSPFVERPEMAALSQETVLVLQRLQACPRVTFGVVSGRPLSDLVQRVGLTNIWYVGNHGYEIRNPAGHEHRFYDDADLRLLEQVRDELTAAVAAVPGAIVEHKGPVVAVHYRLVDEARVSQVQAAFLGVIERHHREVMMAHGNRVLEARLRGNCNKGSAVRHVRRELPRDSLIVYFGDDLTDRDAFRALRGLGVSVQIGQDEAGLADYTLPDPAAVVEVFQRIERALSEPKAVKRRTARRAKS